MLRVRPELVEDSFVIQSLESTVVLMNSGIPVRFCRCTVFRPGTSGLGALPSTVATSRQDHSSQSRSIESINSSIIKEFKIRNTEEISDRTEWTANPFASTPDPPKGFAPKSPPELEMQRRANEVVASPTVSPTVASVSFDVIAFPGYIVPSQLKEEELQPSTHIPPPTYSSLVQSGNSGKADVVAKRKQSQQSTYHRRNGETRPERLYGAALDSDEHEI